MQIFKERNSECKKELKKVLTKIKLDLCFLSTHSEEIHFDYIKLLKQNSFNIIAEHTLAESYSTDGLVVAAHKTMLHPKVSISKRMTIESILVRLKYLFK
jgi:hypothetical protein